MNGAVQKQVRNLNTKLNLVGMKRFNKSLQRIGNIILEKSALFSSNNNVMGHGKKENGKKSPIRMVITPKIKEGSIFKYD
jgi:hypothetical protein